MKQSAQRITNGKTENPEEKPSRRLSSLKFFVRYPIFLLALGPPIFRAPNALRGFDTSQAHFDIWSVFQVAWIAVPTVRAIIRLIFARSLSIPKQIQAVLRLAFFLGLLYLISVIYSPGRVISAEFAVLYSFTMICVVEFVVDVYRNPPNWVQCLFQLRLVAILGLIIVLLTVPFAPDLVVNFRPGVGIRFLGGTVGTVYVICPVIAIISAYSFLHSLESRLRSTAFLLIGMIGTLITQWRGAEIALLVVCVVLGVGWAKTSRRAAYISISAFMAFVLLAGAVVGAVRPERIWKTFNRGQSAEGIATLSGRTGTWTEVIRYSIDHPQGMGYIAGIRWSRIGSGSAASMHARLNNIGGTDSSYLQNLADAGWLCLALYLIMLAKIIVLGLRFAKKAALKTLAIDRVAGHAIRCALLLLLFCLVTGIDTSVFVTPLSQGFYFQNIIIAVVLGASTSMLISSRSQNNRLG